MPQLSVVIITFNEERNIRRCLESLLGVADDIVVVDSFSTDKTKEICEEFGVNFIQKEWEGYSATKNFANTQAKHDWILSIDADEALSKELSVSITEAKKGGPDTYKVNRLTNYCGQWIRHSGWYPDQKIRLFDRRNTEWQGFIHETLVFKNTPTIKSLRGNLLHYSYYTVDEHRAQTRKFALMKAKNMKEKGKKYNPLEARFRSIYKFFRTYVLKLGFLDGKFGLTIAKISAYGVMEQHKALKNL